MREGSRPQTKGWAGTIIDRKYRLISPLGHGGMASVFLAERLHLRDNVAIKVLQARSDEDALRRFQVEAAAAAKVKHPNVVTIYDFGLTEDGTVYIVMELLEGPGLDQEMYKVGRMSAERVLEIIKPVCSAINAAHSVGLLHRDIKPPNIILHSSKHEGEIVKVVDFGIAKFFESTDLVVKTSEGIVLGTAEYMSPEQCQGLDLDGQTDIYSLAVVCYQMLTGKLPYDAATTGEYLIKHVRENPLPLHRRWNGIDPRVEAVIMQSLDKNPQTRPKGALEFCYLLEQAVLEKKNKKISNSSKTEKLDKTSDKQIAKTSVREKGTVVFNCFVGRSQELNQLMQNWQQTCQGQNRPILVLGNAGVGKTELLAEFARQIKEQQAFVFQTRCYRSPGIKSFYAFIGDLKNLFARLQTNTTTLEEIFGNTVSPIMDLLSKLWQTGKLIDPNNINLETRQYYFSLLTQAFVMMSRQRPVLIVLDDLNWADETARELLDYFNRALSRERVLIVASARFTGETENFSQWLKNCQRDYEVLTLSPFKKQQVYEVLTAIFGQPAFTEQQFNQLLADSGGNAYFLTEHLRLLVSNNRIKFDGERWNCQDFKDQIPQTLIDLVDLTLDRLPSQTQQALSIASVIGEEFELNTLQTVANLTEEILPKIIQEAIENGLITELVELERYQFNNLTIRRILYEKLNKRTRRRIHRSIAEWLTLNHMNSDKRLSKTAYHYYEAGEWSQAFNQSVKSAQIAAISLNINELHKYLIWAEKSLVGDEKLNKLEILITSDKIDIFEPPELLENIKQLATYYWLCGISLIYRNRGLSAEQLLQKALKLVQVCQEKYLLGEIYFALATIRSSNGAKAEAIDLYKRALIAYHQVDHLLGQGQILRQMSTIYELRGDYSLALDSARAAVDIARLSDNQKLESFALSSEAWILCKLNRFEESAIVAKRALALARQSDEPATRCSCYNTIAQIYLQQGLYQEAIDPQKESLRLARGLGNRRFEAIVCDNLGELYFRTGKYSESENYFLKVLKLVEANGNRYFEQTTLQNLAKVYIKQGKPQQARAYLTRVETLATTVDLLEARCEFCATTAELLLAEGKYKEALTQADQAITQARIIGSLEHEWLPWLIKTQALLELERIRAASDAIEKTISIIENISGKISDISVKEKYLAYTDRQLAFKLFKQIQSQEKQ